MATTALKPRPRECRSRRAGEMRPPPVAIPIRTLERQKVARTMGPGSASAPRKCPCTRCPATGAGAPDLPRQTAAAIRPATDPAVTAATEAGAADREKRRRRRQAIHAKAEDAGFPRPVLCARFPAARACTPGASPTLAVPGEATAHGPGLQEPPGSPGVAGVRGISLDRCAAGNAAAGWLMDRKFRERMPACTPSRPNNDHVAGG